MNRPLCTESPAHDPVEQLTLRCRVATQNHDARLDIIKFEGFMELMNTVDILDGKR